MNKRHCAEDVGIAAITRHPEQPMGIVKLDPELEVLLDDIFDGDW